MSSLVHTYELLQPTSTDLNCIKPQVNGHERHGRDLLSRVSSSYFWERDPDHPGPLTDEHPPLLNKRTFGA
jgi:hypothetical protein